MYFFLLLRVNKDVSQFSTLLLSRTDWNHVRNYWIRWYNRPTGMKFQDVTHSWSEKICTSIKIAMIILFETINSGSLLFPRLVLDFRSFWFRVEFFPGFYQEQSKKGQNKTSFPNSPFLPSNWPFLFPFSGVSPNQKLLKRKTSNAARERGNKNP